MRIKGQIVRWFPERGYGFAKVRDGHDIYVHAAYCVNEGVPFVGAEITFEILEERGRRRANKVRVLSKVMQ